MKTCFILCCWLLLGSPHLARAQAPGAALQARTYDFVGRYFRHPGLNDGRPYRLAARQVPVVSPYADHFDLRQVLSASYLTERQFISTVRVDTLLSEADFAAMRGQLAAWQRRPRWSKRRLRAAGVAVLPHESHRPNFQLPSFTTYRIFAPLFSENGRIALFYVENYCGLDCAGGQVNVLRQQPDGSWRFVLGVPIFVS